MLLRWLIVLTAVTLACQADAQAPYGREYPFGPRDPLAELAQVVITYRILLNLAAAVLGLLVGALFSPLLAPLRRILLVLLVLLLAALAIVGPFPGLAELMAIGVFILGFSAGVQLGRKLHQKDEAEAPPTSFGSARWATASYLHEQDMLGGDPTAGRGFVLGRFVERGYASPLTYTGQRHLLTVAPTRSGKGVSAIIPNLLTYTGSALVIDPKGENALVTARRRNQGRDGMPGLGQKVFLIDPWDIAASQLQTKPARFNPLEWIRINDPDAAENAFLLADALVPEGGQGEARFWDDEAKALLSGVILYVATAESEAARRHLGRVRDILLLGDSEMRELLTAMFNHPLPVVASTAARTAAKDPKLRANVFAAVQSHTHFLDSPRIRESLSATDCSFEALKTERVTIYLILPADRLKTFDRWLRLLIQQAVTVNARNIAVKPEQPVLFILDEMPSLGRLTMVEQAYGLLAGFGIQLWGVVQDLSQLNAIYREGWQTFVSNSGVIQYFGSRDKMTAEYFSSLCGVTTVRVVNLASAIGSAVSYATSVVSAALGGGSTSRTTTDSSSSTFTHSYNESQRQLAYPDELMVLKGYQQIVFIENLDAIRAEKVAWFEEPTLSRWGVSLHAKRAPHQVEEASSQTAAAVDPPADERTTAALLRSILILLPVAAKMGIGRLLSRFQRPKLPRWRSLPITGILLLLTAPVAAYAVFRPGAWAQMFGYPIERVVRSAPEIIRPPPEIVRSPPELVRDFTKLSPGDLRRTARIKGSDVSANRQPTGDARITVLGETAPNALASFTDGFRVEVNGVATNRANEIWYHITFSNGAGFVRGSSLVLQ